MILTSHRTSEVTSHRTSEAFLFMENPLSLLFRFLWHPIAIPAHNERWLHIANFYSNSILNLKRVIIWNKRIGCDISFQIQLRRWLHTTNREEKKCLTTSAKTDKINNQLYNPKNAKSWGLGQDSGGAKGVIWNLKVPLALFFIARVENSLKQQQSTFVRCFNPSLQKQFITFVFVSIYMLSINVNYINTHRRGLLKKSR